MREAICGLLNRLAAGIRRSLRPELIFLRIGPDFCFPESIVPAQIPCAVSRNLDGLDCVLELRPEEPWGLVRLYELLGQLRLDSGPRV